MTKSALALFAKCPVAGTVKTRLTPPLDERQTAMLAAAFLEDSANHVVRIAKDVGAKPCLFYDPPSASGEIQNFLPAGLTLYPQSNGGLADRLKAAYDALAGEGIPRVCFIGADSPTVPPAYVARAFSALDSGWEVVVGPASDGGYYLIGLRSARLELFDGIDWSTERVFMQTRARAEQLGISFEVLPEWYDVDDAAGLERLRRELFDGGPEARRGAAAPRTRAALASLFASDRTRGS